MLAVYKSQLCAQVTGPSPSSWCERSVRVSCVQWRAHESPAPPPPAGASGQWESAVSREERMSQRPLPLRLVRAVSESQLCPGKSAWVTGPSPSGWCERSVRVSCAHESQAPPPPAGASGQWESAVCSEECTSHRPLPLWLVWAVSESQLCPGKSAWVKGPSPSGWCERSVRVSCVQGRAHESQAPPPPAGVSGQWESAVHTSHRPLPLRLVRAVSESQLCAVKSARVTGPSPSGWCERSVRVSCVQWRAHETQVPPPTAGASGQRESAVRTSHRLLPLRLVRAVSESQLCARVTGSSPSGWCERSVRVSCAHESQAPPPPAGVSGQWESAVCSEERTRHRLLPLRLVRAVSESQLCARVTGPSPSGWCERSVRVSCVQWRAHESQVPPPPAGASGQWESAVCSEERTSHRPLPLRLVWAVSESQLCAVKSARVTGPSPSGWCERSVKVSCVQWRAHETQAPPPPAGVSGQWESAVCSEERTRHRLLPLRLVRAVSESQLCARVTGSSPSGWCERSVRVSCVQWRVHESQAPPPPAGASGQWESAVRTSHRPLPLRLVRAVSESQLCAVKSARVTGPSPSGWCERSVRVSCAHESQAPPPPAGASGQWESAVSREERTSHRLLPLQLVQAVSESQQCPGKSARVTGSSPSSWCERSVRVSCAHESQAPPPPAGASGQWESAVSREERTSHRLLPLQLVRAVSESQQCPGKSARVTGPSPSSWCKRSARVSSVQGRAHESQAPPPPAGASGQWESAVRTSHRLLPLQLVRAVSESQLCPGKSARVTGSSPSGWCERSVRVSSVQGRAHESQAPPPPAGASGQWESAVRTSHGLLPLRLVQAVSESQLCARVTGSSPSGWCEWSVRVSCVQWRVHESQAPPPPAGASGQRESAVFMIMAEGDESLEVCRMGFFPVM